MNDIGLVLSGGGAEQHFKLAKSHERMVPDGNFHFGGFGVVQID